MLAIDLVYWYTISITDITITGITIADIKEAYD
jgi:hypothetical protein